MIALLKKIVSLTANRLLHAAALLLLKFMKFFLCKYYHSYWIVDYYVIGSL